MKAVHGMSADIGATRLLARCECVCGHAPHPLKKRPSLPCSVVPPTCTCGSTLVTQRDACIHCLCSLCLEWYTLLLLLLFSCPKRNKNNTKKLCYNSKNQQELKGKQTLLCKAKQPTIYYLLTLFAPVRSSFHPFMTHCCNYH